MKMLRTMLAILPLAAFAVGCGENPPAKPTPKPDLGKPADTKVEAGKGGVKVETKEGAKVEVTPKDGGVKVETKK